MLMKRGFATTINASALDTWLLISRIAIGIFMLTHGIPKLEKLMAGNMQFADPFGIGAGPSLVLTVFAEAFCAALLILGLATRFATIPLIITMLVAVFIAHGSDPFGKKEMALLYLLAFVGLLITGPGKYSIDNWISNKGRNRHSL